MAKTTIYLIRHGQTEWNVEKRMQGQQDSQLTDLGKLQAAKISEHLQDLHIDALFSSPSKRAFDTARAIKGNRDLHITPVHELMEIALGELEGKKYYDLLEDEKFSEMARNFREAPEKFENPTGENFVDIRNRVMPFINDTCKIFKGKTVVLVSHTCTIKTVLNTIEGRHIKDFWTPMIEPTSYSIIECENSKLSVVAYGCADHLGGSNIKGPF